MRHDLTADQTAEPPEPTADLSPLEILGVHNDADHLHSLGPRAVAEMLLEAVRLPVCRAPILAGLARYRRISRTQVDAAGADRSLRFRLKAVP